MPGKPRASLPLLAAGMAFCLAPILAALPAPAQPAAPAVAPPPATSPADGAALDVFVTEVMGTVQASRDDGKSWTPAKTGLHLSGGASFRTGFRSSVTCGIAPDQSFTLESLSTVRVEEAVKKGGRFKTDLVMKYGATNYSIETGLEEHVTTIRTPGATLFVRGTVVRVTDRVGFAPTAESFTGRAVYKTAHGTTTVGSKGGGYARVAADEGDAAQTALSQTVVDPNVALARTASEQRLIAQQVSLGALVSFDYRANITVVKDSGPLSDAQLLSSLPGTLDFVLRWTGNANLNLIVYDQPVTAQDIAAGTARAPTLTPPASGVSPVNLGQIGITLGFQGGFQPKELLFPGYGLNISPTGGVIPYDNRGGPSGGMEIAYWPGTPPQGLFGVAMIHQSGPAVDYTINAFLNGSPLNINYSNSPTGIPVMSTQELKGTATGKISDGLGGGVVYSPPNPYLENLTPQGNGETLGYVPNPATPSAAHAGKPAKAGNNSKAVSASATPLAPAPTAMPVRGR